MGSSSAVRMVNILGCGSECGWQGTKSARFLKVISAQVEETKQGLYRANAGRASQRHAVSGLATKRATCTT